MDSAARLLLTWLGRLCLLAIPVVFVLAVARPQSLRPVDAVLCPAGQQVEASGPRLDSIRDDLGRLTTVCTSSDLLTDVTRRVYAVMGAAFLGAVAAYTLRARITPPALSAPDLPLHA